MLIDEAKFLEQIQKDLSIDKNNLESELYNMSIIREKYSRLFTRCKKKFVDLTRQLQETKAERYVYYNEQYEGPVLKNSSEIETYIENDKEYKKINKEYTELQIDFDYLKTCLENVNSKGWDLKNILEYRRQIYQLGNNPDYQ